MILEDSYSTVAWDVEFGLGALQLPVNEGHNKRSERVRGLDIV